MKSVSDTHIQNNEQKSLSFKKHLKKKKKTNPKPNPNTARLEKDV